MFPIEQTTKQPASATGFAINQANYINLTSSSDKQLVVYVTISFDDGSSKDETVTFSGLDYNSANTAFATWGGIIAVLEAKLGVKLTIPANIEEMFQNVPPLPPEEEKAPENVENTDHASDVPVEESGPVSLPAQEETPPTE